MSQPGGISCIFESVKSLDSSFLHVDKQNLVAVKPAAGGSCSPTGLLQSAFDAASFNVPKKKVANLPTVYYGRTKRDCNWLTSKQGGYCGQCCYSHQQVMSVLPQDLKDLEAVIGVVDGEKANCSSGQGFVRENITYMVTDSLEIMPSTTIRSIKVLNKLKVATPADLESADKTVSITQVLSPTYSCCPFILLQVDKICTIYV